MTTVSTYPFAEKGVLAKSSEPEEPFDPREGVRRALELSAGSKKSKSVSDEELDEFLSHLGENCPSRCKLFDERFYLSQLPVRIAMRVNPVLHYLEIGAANGLLPHPLFDPQYVRRQRELMSDAVSSGSDWLDVLASCEAPFISPHPLFDPEVYFKSTGRSQKRLSENPIITFIKGWPEERQPFSPYFDCDFYIHQVPHLRNASMDPLSHYLLQPDELRLDPNPMVHGKYYQNRYPDVRGDALSHYVQFGMPAGREPNPYAYQELGELGMTPKELYEYICVWRSE